MGCLQRSSGSRMAREQRDRPFRPFGGGARKLHCPPLRWRFSRLNADQLADRGCDRFSALRPAFVRGLGCRPWAARWATLEKTSRSSWACTSSPQAVGGPPQTTPGNMSLPPPQNPIHRLFRPRLSRPCRPPFGIQRIAHLLKRSSLTPASPTVSSCRLPTEQVATLPRRSCRPARSHRPISPRSPRRSAAA